MSSPKKRAGKKPPPAPAPALADLPLAPAPSGPEVDAFWAMIARIETVAKGELAASCKAFRGSSRRSTTTRSRR
ncbi:MAG: hypothetical protein U0414_16825 [Polyangiaceae bacterium]